MRSTRVASRLFQYRTPSFACGAQIRKFSSIRYYAQIPGQQSNIPEDDSLDQDDSPKSKEETGRARLKSTAFKMLESASTTFASLLILGLAGYSYHLYYKSLVLRKMSKAFDPGDPVLDLAAPTPSAPIAHSPTTSSSDSGPDASGEGESWIERPEQHLINSILTGARKGRYYLLIGEKGTGKSSMIIEAMRRVNGAGISMFDAHADLEIFRVRLGKALNYEFHEDYIGSLFSVRGPRDTTALLDIERAFNKLEKIALARRKSKEPPLTLIVNSAHLIRPDDDGRDLLELIQQRAEAWAASQLVTVVLNSDDYWVYERLKRDATRMEVIPVKDLPKSRALAALSAYRTRYFPDQPLPATILEQIYDRVGGRINYLSRVAKSHDMLGMCARIEEAEKTWFLNRCGILGEPMDDDVMDQQKFASCAMVLAKALVEKEKAMDMIYSPETGHILPEYELFRARQIMTRADFIEKYDHDNLFTIDSRAMVRADSVPMMRAFREIVAEEGFEEFLQDTLDRISAIESIGRTRELTFKDLWTEQSGDQRGAYQLKFKDSKGRETGSLEMRVVPDETEGEDEGKDD